MFARYVSHIASRRSCACIPCSKEGTRATESESCPGTRKDGKVIIIIIIITIIITV